MIGCDFCPVENCTALTYRGSDCAVFRHMYGVDFDPDIRTNGDFVRAMPDEKLAEAISRLYVEEDVTSLCELFCDGKAGCIDGDGNVLCNDDKIKACILRWLQQPIEEEKHGE